MHKYLFVFLGAGSLLGVGAAHAASKPRKAKHGTQDCGTNHICMIRSAAPCDSTKGRWVTQTPMGDTTVAISFKPGQGLHCAFQITFLKMESKQAPSTPEEQKQQEKLAKAMVGRKGTCDFPSGRLLADLLGRWDSGNFSTDDFKDAQCQGTYFQHDAFVVGGD